MRTRIFVVGLAVCAGLTAAAIAAQTPAPGQAAAPKKAAAATPAACGPTPPAELKDVATGSRCFELRTYTVRADGRGDLALLHKRFREATMMYFKKHGHEVVGFWQSISKPDTLVYVLAYKDAAARDAAWAAFQADPGWVQARNDMTVDITFTSDFMIATDYAPVK